MTKPPPEKRQSMPLVQNVQALRLVAALLVVWTHLKFFAGAKLPGGPLSDVLMSAVGASGVDIFFVISGFVISMTVDKRHHEPGEFMLARIARVAPLYLVLTALELAFHRDLWNWRSIWNGVFYLPLFDQGAYVSPPIRIGWTLSFEMWFYTIFALLMVFLPLRRLMVVLPFAFVAIVAAGTFYSGNWYFPHFISHPFVLEFAMGVIVYQARHMIRGLLPWIFIVLAVAGFVASLPRAEELSTFNPEPSMACLRVLAWGVPAAFLVAGAVGLEQARGIVFPRFMVTLGAASYALYLTHITSLATVGRAATFLPVWAIVALEVPVCIAVAWLVHRWVERPLTERAQAWAKRLAKRGAVSSRSRVEPAELIKTAVVSAE